jgi:hypothetical protein
VTPAAADRKHHVTGAARRTASPIRASLSFRYTQAATPRPKAIAFPSSRASRAWFGWRTIAQQSLRLLSAVAPLQRRAASMRRFSLPAPALKATRRGRARERSRPRARRSRRTLLLRPRTRTRRSRRAVRTIAATSTGMALRLGATSGSTIGQRAVTRQGSETTSGAHTVAVASRPISGKAGGPPDQKLKPCRSPATKKGRCRLHGGASGAGSPPASGMGNTVTASGPRPRSRSSRNSAHC